jgi:energy-coupling factor transporter ATP-binding protein EcfA2
MKLDQSQKRINELMSLFVVQIEGSASMNMTDLNKTAENVLIPLLNEVYGWDLKNLNSSEEDINYPGIDLGDETAKISVQVTATSKLGKIEETLNQFIKKAYYRKYNRLIIYILKKKQNSYSKTAIQKLIQNTFNFDPQKDIWDFRNILQEVKNLQIEQTLKIEEILEANFGESASKSDNASDWSKLATQSIATATQVQNAIAGRVHLQRDSCLIPVRKELENNEAVAIVGASGVGKSAIARALFEAREAAGERTLWFDARSFERPDFNSFEADLSLRNPLSDILSKTPVLGPVLILDGLDRLYCDAAFQIVARLLSLVRQPESVTQWRIVLPCQAQEWPRVYESIQRAGFLGSTWKQVEVQRLSAQELSPVGTSIPALAKLLLQPSVTSLLGNLKILDLVARRAHPGSNLDAAAWVGESSVANWFWTAEVDRGEDRIARGSFTRRLAQLQADLLLASVPVDDFGLGELGPLKSLDKDHICLQVTGDRLAFAHDLYGDWARLRILLNNRADLPGFLHERRDSPLWHRAVRLFGVHLLEQPGGVEEWRKVLRSFGTDEFGAVQDLLLEAPIFSVNALSLLEAILPDLLVNSGVLLRRLLTRFLAFATVPNLEMVTKVQEVGLDESQARATYRSPHWPYWPDVLRFLYTHRAEVLAVASCQLARVVQLWMDFAPKGSALRAEAAELGVLLGRRAIETREEYRGRDYKQDRQRFYICALGAAHERPDEVVEIALIASERTTREDSPSLPASPYDVFAVRPLPPWPDGPRSSVDDEFQSAVLDTRAILELFRVRPNIAREVVLASLIAPHEEDNWNHLTELHLVKRRHPWQPVLYIDGPFLACLRINFDEGLELIARLVEFATSRWCDYIAWFAREYSAHLLSQEESEAQVEHVPSPPEDLVIGIGAEARTFAGGEHVYGWSTGMGSPPDAVQASLMALEQYFYLQLNEGKDVETEVVAVLTRVKSVAFLKVLCDVGKRQQVLFEGPLRSLLSAPELYEWDISAMSQEIPLTNYRGRIYFEEASKFHQLEHRKTSLLSIAVQLMLYRPAMQKYFSRVRAHWESIRAPHSTSQVSPMVDQLIVELDPSNYELREDPQHGTVFVNVKDDRILEEQADELRAMTEHFLETYFPQHCRTILDDDQVLSNEELVTMWERWQRIREPAHQAGALPNGEGSSEDKFANNTSGGIAVFLRHLDWCRREPSRMEELLSSLRALLERPPQGALDVPENVSAWTWDCFAAESLAVLWAYEPANTEWRQAVARMVFAPHYAAVKLLFARCAERRASLGADFSRLRRLALEWAYVRKRVDLLRQVPLEALQLEDEALERMCNELTTWLEERIATFVSGSMGLMPTDWSECDHRQKFAELDAALTRWRRSIAMDFHLVRRAHEWLPLPDKSADNERSEWIQFWRSALDFVLNRPIANSGQCNHEYPDEDERWILDKVAAVVLQLRPNEMSESLWQAVLDLSGNAHYWPKDFAHALHRHALTVDQPPSSYAGLLRCMVQYAFTDFEGKRRWSSFEQVWDALLGLDFYSCNLWKPCHAELVASLSDVFDLWMAQVPPDGHRLANFATWLVCPAAVSVRHRSLVWFLKLLRVESGRELRDIDEAADAVASLLKVIWVDDQQRLRSDSQAFDAFFGLLRWLCDRQNARGLDLLGQIGSLA